MDTSPLYTEYKGIAERLFSASHFYRIPAGLLPQTIKLEHVPSVIVFKDDTFMVFNPQNGTAPYACFWRYGAEKRCDEFIINVV